jgi:hypothetical protein
MEHEEEKPKAFKVDDRRRFSAEGDLKPEFQESAEEHAAPEPPPATKAVSPIDDAHQADTHAHGAHDHDHDHDHDHHAHGHDHDHDHPHDHPHDHGEDTHDHHGHAHGDTPEITFGTFLVSLSTQALMHLGDIPDPQTGRPEQDLVAAQQLIDIIGMLQQKTRGNLDREEGQLIDAILYELRMKYVERARTAR